MSTSVLSFATSITRS